MNVLITGATGFIGSSLAKHLQLFPQLSVFALTRQETGQFSGNIRTVSADMNKEGFENLLPKKIDCIVHTAQSKSYREFPDKSEEIFRINVSATLTLLEWARKNGVGKFIFLSSGNVYKSEDKLLTEDAELDAFSFYGHTKIMGEQLCKSYSDYLDIIVLRPFCVYGPGQKDMLIQNIYTRIQNKQPIALAKGVGLKITPLYIDDCTDIISKLIMSQNAKKIRIYNLGGTEAVSIKDIGDAISAAANLELSYQKTDNSPLYLMGDISKLKTDFSFAPRISFREGINRTFNKHDNK